MGINTWRVRTGILFVNELSSPGHATGGDALRPRALRERRIVCHLKCKTGIVTGSISGTGLAIAGHGKYAKRKRRWDPSSITRNVRKNLHFIYASPPITIRDDG